MGDPAGVGPELCLRMLADADVRRLCHPVVFGRSDMLRRVAAVSGVPFPADVAICRDAAVPKEISGPAVVDCDGPAAEGVVPGKVDRACGAAAYGFIAASIRAAMSGWIDGVATAPIHKEALHLAGIRQPGHTEIFTELTGSTRSCMLLWSEVLAVSMVTTHVGYFEVPDLLTPERVLDVIELTAEALTGINGRPARLAVCGLNPHAGEHGLFGRDEEERAVEPAIRAAREKGIEVTGPLPPDTAFTAQQRKRFDGIVCLYHDQGHIPFKMLAFDDGVNITLGLPIVRASVDHGTAFDIAWKGVAKPLSMFKAVESAVRLGAMRRAGVRTT